MIPRPTQAEIAQMVNWLRHIGRETNVSLIDYEAICVALADDLTEARALLARYLSPGSSIELNAETDAFIERTK